MSFNPFVSLPSLARQGHSLAVKPEQVVAVDPHGDNSAHIITMRGQVLGVAVSSDAVIEVLEGWYARDGMNPR